MSITEELLRKKCKSMHTILLQDLLSKKLNPEAVNIIEEELDNRKALKSENQEIPILTPQMLASMQDEPDSEVQKTKKSSNIIRLGEDIENELNPFVSGVMLIICASLLLNEGFSLLRCESEFSRLNPNHNWFQPVMFIFSIVVIPYCLIDFLKWLTKASSKTVIFVKNFNFKRALFFVPLVLFIALCTFTYLKINKKQVVVAETKTNINKNFNRDFLKIFFPVNNTTHLSVELNINGEHVADAEIERKVYVKNEDYDVISRKISDITISKNVLEENQKITTILDEVIESPDINDELIFLSDGLYDKNTNELVIYFGRFNFDKKTMNNIIYSSSLKQIQECLCFEHVEEGKQEEIEYMIKSYSCNKANQDCIDLHSYVSIKTDGLHIEFTQKYIKNNLQKL